MRTKQIIESATKIAKDMPANKIMQLPADPLYFLINIKGVFYIGWIEGTASEVIAGGHVFQFSSNGRVYEAQLLF